MSIPSPDDVLFKLALGENTQGIKVCDKYNIPFYLNQYCGRPLEIGLYERNEHGVETAVTLRPWAISSVIATLESAGWMVKHHYRWEGIKSDSYFIVDKKPVFRSFGQRLRDAWKEFNR